MNIIKSTPIKLYDIPSWYIPVFIIGCMLCILLIIAVCKLLDKWKYTPALSLGLMFTYFAVVIIIGNIVKEPAKKPIYEYTVEITEDQSILEFMSKYDIVDRQGEYLIVRDTGK